MRQLSTPQLLPSSPTPARRLSATSGWLLSSTPSRPTTAASPPQPRLSLSLGSGQPFLGLVSPSTLAPNSPLGLVAPLASDPAQPHLPLGLGSEQPPLGLGSGQPPRPWLSPSSSTPESDSLSVDDRCQPPLGLCLQQARLYLGLGPNRIGLGLLLPRSRYNPSIPLSLSLLHLKSCANSTMQAPESKLQLCSRTSQLQLCSRKLLAMRTLVQPPQPRLSPSASAPESDSLSADNCCQPPSASAPLGLGSEHPPLGLNSGQPPFGLVSPSASSPPRPQLQTAPLGLVSPSNSASNNPPRP